VRFSIVTGMPVKSRKPNIPAQSLNLLLRVQADNSSSVVEALRARIDAWLIVLVVAAPQSNRLVSINLQLVHS
jgi:hypothetical protein